MQTNEEIKPTPNKVFKKVWASNLFDLFIPFKSLQRWIVTSSYIPNFLKYVFVICKFRKHNSINKIKEYLNMCSKKIFENYVLNTQSNLSKKTIEELNSLKIIDLFNGTKYDNIEIPNTPINVEQRDFVSNFENSPSFNVDFNKIYKEYIFLFSVNSGKKIIAEYLKYDDIFNNKEFNVTLVNNELKIIYKNWKRKKDTDIKIDVKTILSDFLVKVTHVVNSVNEFNNFEININKYIIHRISELKNVPKNNSWDSGW